jgi:hypothetical protein
MVKLCVVEKCVFSAFLVRIRQFCMVVTPGWSLRREIGYSTNTGQNCRAVRDASLQLAWLSLDVAVPHRYFIRHLASANANADARRYAPLDHPSFSGHFPCFVTYATTRIAATLPFPYSTSIAPYRAEEAGRRRGTGRSPCLFHTR